MQDNSQLNQSKSYKLQNSHIDGNSNELKFSNRDSFLKAIKDGFFLVKIPDDINLESGDKFSQNFFKEKDGNEDIYKGFHKYVDNFFGNNREGYYKRNSDQTEQFFLEKKHWKEYYPADLMIQAEKMKNLAIAILKYVLQNIGIEEKYWDKATGSCINNKGDYHFTFNHFRHQKNLRGLNTHKDSGWVTILRSVDPGLEAYINNEWVSVLPRTGYFIVNFGCAMEILTKNLDNKVSAIIHRVRQVKKEKNENDRFSYALFTDNSLDPAICKGLYSYHKKQGLQFEMNFIRFVEDIVSATYKEEGIGLY